jgi:glucose-1-phosphate cytidylyltransferase
MAFWMYLEPNVLDSPWTQEQRHMKAVILAGGLGTRLSEETHLRPKPMVGRPILWHIMKGYLSHGVTEFIICCGYKGYMIKEFFANYALHTSDVTFDMANQSVILHENKTEPWKITLVDTGDNSNTGGRLRRVKNYLNDGEDFCFTYGDGVSNVDIFETLRFHKANGKQATVTSVEPAGRYGAMQLDGDTVKGFAEKPHGQSGWINGGFFVLSKNVIALIKNDQSSWELDVLPVLAKNNQLMTYRHKGFWQAMDTLRERNLLEDLWQSGKAPWKTWE